MPFLRSGNAPRAGMRVARRSRRHRRESHRVAGQSSGWSHSPGADVVRRHNQVLPELALKTNRPLVDKRLPKIIGSYLNARWTPRLYVTEWVSQSASSTCGNSDRQTNAVHEELELACFNHVMIEI